MDDARKMVLAAKIGNPPEKVPEFILDILHKTSADTPILSSQYDARVLYPADTEKIKATEEYFVLFCKGMQIAYERYGYTPGKFFFIKEANNPNGVIKSNIFYDVGSDSVVIKVAALEEFQCKDCYHLHHLMRDINLTPEESTLLSGFEEGFHACEKKNEVLKQQLKQRQQEIDLAPITVSAWDGSGEIEYRADAGEAMVAELKRELIKELGQQNPPIAQL